MPSLSAPSSPPCCVKGQYPATWSQGRRAPGNTLALLSLLTPKPSKWQASNPQPVSICTPCRSLAANATRQQEASLQEGSEAAGQESEDWGCPRRVPCTRRRPQASVETQSWSGLLFGGEGAMIKELDLLQRAPLICKNRSPPVESVSHECLLPVTFLLVRI